MDLLILITGLGFTLTVALLFAIGRVLERVEGLLKAR
jgi:hypothetical protein